MMLRLNVPTRRGVVLNGVLFRQEEKKTADTVMIAITGIHGNFYSNPFYYNIGDTLNAGGIDFIYAQTNDAFGQIETVNVNTGKSNLHDVRRDGTGKADHPRSGGVWRR